MQCDNSIVGKDDQILVTGATGFLGSKVVASLLELGFRQVRCLVRPSADLGPLEPVRGRLGNGARPQIFKGNLLSREDCEGAVQDVAVIFHVAATRDGKSFPDAFMNTVVTTRNLLEATRRQTDLRRFVNVSSFAVYSNRRHPQANLLDENCPIHDHPELTGEAYCYAKVKQDEIVAEYSKTYDIPCVTVRPSYIYGPGHEAIPGRVGIGTFGLFLHLGGSNELALTYVDNCAEAVVLTGLRKGVDGEVFNVVDDDLPSSRHFLREYKKKVGPLPSIYVPHALSYLLSCMWEKYSHWSEGQLPLAFNRARWHMYWKNTHYSNAKLKAVVGWAPRVSTAAGLETLFQACRNRGSSA
jgi:nucleoside-diphosphate-sugar epimerase